MLPPETPPMLDQDQVDAFHRDGYLVMRGMIRDRQLALLRSAADEVVEDGVSDRGDHHLYNDGPAGRRYWRSERMFQRQAIFRAVALDPELVTAVAQCVGEACFPWNDSLVVKLRRGGPAVAWHQDPPYGDPARTRTFAWPNFTTDIYLDHSDESNGCVWAIPGRHLLGTCALAGRDQEELFTRCGAVPLRMEPGDVLFHAVSTPHGSRPNLGGATRRTYYIHYLGESVRRDSYNTGGWATQKPGAGPEMDARFAAMRAARAELALDPCSAAHLGFVHGGIAVTGIPTTPPGHWGALGAAIPPASAVALRALPPRARAQGV
jgi:phytanoyl-CoA hydroxylase